MLDFKKILALLLQLTVLVQVGVAEFSLREPITMSNSLVEATGVTYTFVLSYTRQITGTDSKIVMRFPVEFETTFENPVCEAIRGFSGALVCEYKSSVRLLTITGGFPSIATPTEIEFSVAGITNPKYAATTGVFTVDSYVKSGGEFINLEPSSPTINVTPTAGAITNESLSLQDSTVGAYSSLTIGLTTLHVIPKNGAIEIQFPKWNYFASSANQYQSFVATSTSPGIVNCNAISNIPVFVGTNLDCIFTHGETSDTLKVSFDSLLIADIPAATSLSFSVDNVRGPTSTTAVTGFSFKTQSKSGDTIDQSSNASAIQLKVDSPLTGQSSNMVVESSDPSINAQSTLTMRVLTTNPLQTDSNIQFLIPVDFDMSSITTVGTLGNALRNPVDFEVDQLTRIVSIKKFNSQYIPSREFIYFQVGPVTNPSQTDESATFTYRIFDPVENTIEEVLAGITFTATAGGFADASVVASEYLINESNVDFTFTMRTQDTFTSAAIIKITLPAQIYVENESRIKAGTDGIVSIAGSDVEVKFNRILYIRNAFPSGMPVIQPFSITLSDFNNPSTTQTTDSFEIKIFYVENTNEVSDYLGNSLTFTALPSTALSMTASMTEIQTGEIQTNFVISGTMEINNPVEKQAYLRVKIPGQFTVSNGDRVASTCTRITGFSDEISCEFEKVINPKNGNYLIVKGGFDSTTFTGTDFSFSIAEIKNPFTTEQTDSFKMEIYDKYEGMMYTSNNVVKLQSASSDFAFAHVESQSNVNGVNSILTVTLTLGVDTSQGAWLEFSPPDDVIFQDDLVCRGVQNLRENLDCRIVADGVRRINLISDDLFQTTAHKNGTTIQFEIGYLRNPTSLKTSGFFYMATYTAEGMNKYYINESKNQVRLQNQVPGPITISSIVQTNQELGAQTQLKVEFSTNSPIPSGSSMTFTLPANIDVSDNASMTMNGVQVLPSINIDAKQFSLASLPEVDQTNFVIEFLTGLKNPTSGPYSFNYLQIEFYDIAGYSIDKVTRQDDFIENSCTSNCETCNGSLSSCTSCSYNEQLEVSFYLKDSSCIEDCGKGFFQDSGYQCSACSSSCLECRVANNACTLCNPLLEKPYADPVTLRCYDECPSGTYLDAPSTTCMPCVSPCYQCTSPDACLSCDRVDIKNKAIFFFQQESKCYQECPTTSVPTPSKQCDQCEAPCETCENLTKNCLSCLEGTYLHKNYECVDDCPFLYFEDDETRTCNYLGELSLPLPFTIIAFVISVGVGISAWLKGADKEGREQEGTAFFMAMLAIVDIMLRICWAVLAYSVYQKEFYTTFGCFVGLQGVSLFMNIFLWRRYFYSKYRYEDQDPLFSAYVNKYPATANVIIFFSYLLSFQAIRLTYSRFLGKKKFMARFSKRLRYFRLIGRLTVLEIFLLYIPAVVINAYSLTVITDKKEQQFWFNIDSLIMVLYAIILITVVLTQREKLMNYKSYFKFGELFKFGDDEDMDEQNQDDVQEFKQDVGVMALTSERGDMSLHEDEDKLEVQSAKGHEDLAKLKMYQLEQRYGSQDGGAVFIKDKQLEFQGPRTVSAIDYAEYRKLEDKRDRIMLKKTLYERKKVNDEGEVVKLNGELNLYQRQKEDLNGMLAALKKQLKQLQKEIVSVDKNRRKELHQVEQEKRRDIIRRAGKEVPYQSHSGVTSNSRSKSQLTKSNISAVSKSPRDPPGVSGAQINANNANRQKNQRRQRGGQKNAQMKSPDNNMNTVPAHQSDAEMLNQRTENEVLVTLQPDEQNSSMILQQSPNIFQANLNLSEPQTVPHEEQKRQKRSPNNRGSIADPDMDTVKGDGTWPALERPGPDDSTERFDNLQKPNINRRMTSQYTQHQLEQIQETEVADNLKRPLDSLQSDAVENRVEQAVLEPQNSRQSPGLATNLESFGPPQTTSNQQTKKPNKDDIEDNYD